MRLSIMLLVLIGSIGAQPQRPVILLFGASWCAPCIAEIRDLPRLAEAVAPDRLVVAWTDGDVGGLVPRVPPNVELVEGSRAQQGLEAMAGDVSGLPYAVMLDGQGKRCAEWRGPLRAVDVPRFRALCR